MTDAAPATGRETVVPELDHIVILVHSDLDAATEAYRAMGFHLTPRGHHSLGSSNNLAIFGHNYLELLGYEPGRAGARAGMWDDPRGLSGVVWRCPDPLAAAARVKAAGIAEVEPLNFTRPVETDAGTFDAAFTVLHLPRIGFEGGRSFFCHHKTPELVWRPEWQGHANGVTDIATFYFAAQDPAAALGMFDNLFGAGTVGPVPGGMGFKAAEAEVIALTPAAAAARFGSDAPLPEGSLGRMVALGFRTASLDQARAALVAGGLPFTDLGDRLRVGKDATFGLGIEFTL